MGLRHKKAQAYPVFLWVILMLALTFAFIALKDSKRVCKDPTMPCYVASAPAVIGEKQTQVFYTLQDAESVKLFIDQAAKIAAEKSLEDVKYSCTYVEGLPEDYLDLEDNSSFCGVYIYPSWSTKTDLCLPNCTYAFASAFKNSLNEEFSKYYLATKIMLSSDYGFYSEQGPGYFTIKGVANEHVPLLSFPVAIRRAYESRPDAVTSAVVKSVPEPEDSTNKQSAQPTPSTLLPYKAVSKDYRHQKEVLTQPTITVNTKYFGMVPARDREEGKVTKVVLHHTGGGKPGGIANFWANNDGVPSAHYIIDKDGTIYYLIDESMRANHAGCRESGERPICRTYPPPATNEDSIGVEIINSGKASDKYTDAQYRSISQLLQDISRRYGFTADDSNVFGHYQITADNWDPSPNFDWSKIDLSDHQTYTQVASGGCSGLGSFGYSSDCNSPGTSGNQITAAATTLAPSDSPSENKSSSAMKPVDENQASGSYSFRPSFSVRVNKDLSDPLKTVKEWFELTWNACVTNATGCVQEKMEEYNEVEENPFTVNFARVCEPKPLDLFFETMESFEDCMGNGLAGCSCEVNFSRVYSSTNVSLLIESGRVTMKVLKDIGGVVIEEPVEGADYSLLQGGFLSTMDVRKLVLRFNSTGGFEKAEVHKLTRNADSYDEALLFEAPSLKLVKMIDPEGKNDQAEFTNDPNLPICLFKKDKFRLCAKPKMGRTDLFEVKFSMQTREKTAAEKALDRQKCEDIRIDVNALNVKPDSLVAGIAEYKGIDLMSVFSSIPIPALQLATTTISMADIVANLPQSQSGNLQVTVTSDDKNIMGYEVHCNDLPISLGSDYFRTNMPNSFALIESRARELEASARQATTLGGTFPYAAIIDRSGCRVPVPTTSGIVKNVPGALAVESGNMAQFTVAKCGGVNVLMDKLLKKDYCITIVPVDKDGNRREDCQVSNCAQFNSLFDLALKKLLETKLKDMTFVPAGVIPAELNPYVKIPDGNDLVSAAHGQGSLDFSNMINLQGIQGHYTGKMDLLAQQMNRDVTGTAFMAVLLGTDATKRQAVLSALSGQIKDQDARAIFNDIASGRSASGDVQAIALSRATAQMGDDQVAAAALNVVRTDDLRSGAFEAIRIESEREFQQASEQKKREVLVKAAESPGGGSVKSALATRALQSGCVSTPYATPRQTADCLSSSQLSQVYFQATSTEAGARSVLEAQMQETDPSRRRDLLTRAVETGDLEGTARAALLNEAINLPDSAKKDIIVTALNSNGNMDQLIQNQVARMIPTNNPDYLTALMQNRNVNALIGDQFEAQIQKSLNSFLTEQCRNLTN
ncbi:N-acetylmuramoyl-L-alanine amidase [Candidatus Woesearchaeota archaeon]|nr:N-acetylmuramoyl-L-alanine amidase [Candidatus Woesearchaeota archaeon]